MIRGERRKEPSRNGTTIILDDTVGHVRGASWHRNAHLLALQVLSLAWLGSTVLYIFILSFIGRSISFRCAQYLSVGRGVM